MNNVNEGDSQKFSSVNNSQYTVLATLVGNNYEHSCSHVVDGQ